MNRSKLSLAMLAGLMLLMLSFGGVCFLAGAAYLALAERLSPWLAALITGGLLLLPMLAGGGWLWWRARQRQARREHGFEALKAGFLNRAKTEPYEFVGAAFAFGMALSTSLAARRRIAEHMAARKSAD
jgi:hypothetical protein